MTHGYKIYRIQILVGILSILFFALTSTVHAAGPIVIGHVTDTTGSSSFEAPYFQAAINLALSEYNGMVAGRKIEVIHEDGGSKPTLSVEKARKLVEKDGASIIIGPINAGAAAPVTSYLSRSGVPHVTMEMPFPLFKKNGHMFAHQGTQNAAGYLMGKYAAEEMGYRTATVIHDDIIFAEGFLNGAITAFEKAGGKIVQRQRTPMNTMDYGSYLSGMKKADVVMFWFIPPHAFNFLKAYTDYGFEMPKIMAGLNIMNPHMISQLGDAAVGITASSNNDPFVNSPRVRDWVQKWEKMYAGQGKISHPSMAMTCAWYVQMKLALEAIKATGGDTNPMALRKAMRHMKLDTPWGPVTFSDKNIGIGNAYIMKVVKEGGKPTFRQVKMYTNMLRDMPR